MSTAIVARTMSEEYRHELDVIVTALLRAAAIRFNDASFRGPVPPRVRETFRKLAAKAVLSLNPTELHHARAEALREVLEEDELFTPLHDKARAAIDAYEERLGARAGYAGVMA